MTGTTSLDYSALTHNRKLRLAIACQGGGSHGAYTAGFLKCLFKNTEFWQQYELTALCGTSAGAVCAALAWSGLTFPIPQKGGLDTAIQRLDDFWRDLSSRPWDLAANAMVQPWLQVPGLMEIPSPLAQWYTRERMVELLNSHIRVGTAPDRNIRLLLGASDICAGTRQVFEQLGTQVSQAETVGRVLASAAVPPAFEEVAIEERHYWDGLFTTNPPIRELLSEADQPDSAYVKPDVVLIIRINPKTRHRTPSTYSEKIDRRNEMAGNLALEQELAFMTSMNELVLRHGHGTVLFERTLTSAPDHSYKYILPCETKALPPSMTFESKYNIQPDHISRLMRLGCKEVSGTLTRLHAALVEAEHAHQKLAHHTPAKSHANVSAAMTGGE